MGSGQGSETSCSSPGSRGKKAVVCSAGDSFEVCFLLTFF